jgi:nitrite reductase (NADH) small subunit
VVATENGWNLYVGGNDGARPRHAELVLQVSTPAGRDDAAQRRRDDRRTDAGGAPTTTTSSAETRWTHVCGMIDLAREHGVAALVGATQVGVSRTYGDRLFAVENCDPWRGANVLARGIVGTRGALSTVASTIHRQVFDLRTGVCLDDPAMSVVTFAVRVSGGVIEVAVP